MSWPLSQDYNEAIQDPRNSFGDDELKTGEAVANALGIPMPRSGNFADVYEVRCPSGSRWAVKCFTREVAGLRERYQEVSRYLQRTPLPFTVDFTFLDRGIRLRGRWYPILKMQWVEGLTLNEFVRQYADKPDKLEALLQIWVRMSGCLRSAGIAHGDLQHGNLLLVPGSKVNSLAAKLIDYDGMFVPALAGQTSGEVGHPCYQHPQRMRERVYGREVDRFPFLLIATSLCCIQAGGRALWEKYDSGDNLLFREADLLTPVKSPLFYQLLKQSDERSRRLVELTLEALRGDLSRTPLLDNVPELQAPTAIQAGAKAAATQVLRVTPAATTRTEQPIVRRSRRRRKRSRLAAVLVAGLAFLAIVGVSVFLSFDLRSALILDDDDSSPPVARKIPPPSPHPAEGKKVVPPPKRDPPKRDKPDPPRDEKPLPLPDKQPDNPLRLAAEVPKPRELFACKFRHQDAVRAVSVSANGKRALSLGAEGDLHLWDLTDGKWIAGVQSPKGDLLLCAALTPDGKQAIAGGKEKLVYLLDIEKKSTLRVFKGHTGSVNSIALSPDGRQALSGGDDKSVRRWDVATGTEIDAWPAHENAIHYVRFSTDGKRVLTSSVDGAIRIWDARTGQRLFDTSPPPGAPPPSAVTLSPKGEHIVLGLRDGSLLVLTPKQKKPIASIHGAGTSIHNVCFTPDGRYLATLNGDIKSSLAFLLCAEGAKYHRVSFGKQAISPRALAFTPDSRRVVLGCADGTVRIWEINGSASSSHGETGEPMPLPPVKRGDPLIDRAADPVVRKPPDPPPAKPTTPRAGDTIQNSVGMKLAYIPAGKFLMGTSADELAKYKSLPNRGYDMDPKALKEETPKHEVRLTKSFYLGVYEVTQSEYEKVMKKNPSEFKGALLPVDSVSWANAMMFCTKLSELPDEKKAGRSYRLPTEAEWEYACRAGTKTAFHYGDSLSFEDANFNGNFPFGDGSVVKKKGLDTTVEVGKYKANAWGLYDMHGNVWEWCLDGPRLYTADAVQDPQGPESDRHRVLRGGSWDDAAVRSAYRAIHDASNYRVNSCGMRVLCEQKAR
jgi:formylglycine-generating enzyme required for sulfatase activity/serine/threonine protein kinase